MTILTVLLSLACRPATMETGTPDIAPPEDSAPDAAETAEPTETAEPVTDEDGDGFDAEEHGGEDCDDTDPEIYPGAEEVYYDGVDADCDDASDYDADGDGEDAQEYGGEDCDDTDPKTLDCAESVYSPLSDYIDEDRAGEIVGIASNLSGVTWNPATGTYFGVRDTNRRIHELDEEMAPLREIVLENVAHYDTEDIVYLGSDGDEHEFAIVSEDGALVIGVIPEGVEAVDLSTFQTLTFAGPPESSNSGGEGVAYDAKTGRFWICIERNPMTIYSFTRPSGSADASYLDTLSVTEPFDASAAFAAVISDISSCYYDARTDRLLVLSHESMKVLDVDLDGSIIAQMSVSISGNKPEGITIHDSQDMALVGEANDYRIYTWAGQ